MSFTPQTSSIVAKRYAASLIDLAEKAKKIKEVEKDLVTLESMIEISDDFRAFIRSPLISSDEQGKIVAALAKKAGLQKLTANFLGVLVENRRLDALEGTLNAAANEISVRRGEVSASVQTASALTKKQTEDLQKAISKSVGADVLLAASVNPEILGGMVVTIGSYMIDDSVARKLGRLRSRMGRESNQNLVQTVKEA